MEGKEGTALTTPGVTGSSLSRVRPALHPVVHGLSRGGAQRFVPKRFQLEDITHFLVEALQGPQILQLDRESLAVGDPELLVAFVFELAGQAIDEKMGRIDRRPEAPGAAVDTVDAVVFP